MVIQHQYLRPLCVISSLTCPNISKTLSLSKVSEVKLLRQYEVSRVELLQGRNYISGSLI